MIVCPACKYEEVTGAVFCSHCGAQLINLEDIATHRIVTAETHLPIKQGTQPFQSAPPESSGGWISLHLLESGQIIPLGENRELTLGRISEGQPIMPDIDLSVYNAYANGVSRLHIVLKRVQDSAVIMDLGSSNGTYINSTRIQAHKEYPLSHGDILSLGKLKVQVLLTANSIRGSHGSYNRSTYVQR